VKQWKIVSKKENLSGNGAKHANRSGNSEMRDYLSAIAIGLIIALPFIIETIKGF